MGMSSHHGKLLILCWIGLSLGSVFPGPARPAQAQTSVQEIDRKFVAAVLKQDATAASQFLDGDFSWTDEAGRTWSHAEFNPLPKGFLASETEAKMRDYQNIVFFTGVHGVAPDKIRFVRVWIERTSGWRLLLQQDTRVMGKTASPQATVPVGTKCENPCKTIPYQAPSAVEQAVVASWEALEAAVNARDAEGWALHVADEFVFNVKEDGNPLTKADRVATIRKQAEGTRVTDIGAVVPGTMRVWIAAGTALMTDTQQPTVGGNPYRAMRIWVSRDGRWQLVYSQQTVIQKP